MKIWGLKTEIDQKPRMSAGWNAKSLNSILNQIYFNCAILLPDWSNKLGYSASANHALSATTTEIDQGF